MNYKFLSFLPSVLVIIILLVLPTLLHAQPVDPGVDPAPIDGGATIVAAACAGYLTKLKQRKIK